MAASGPSPLSTRNRASKAPLKILCVEGVENGAFHSDHEGVNFSGFPDFDVVLRRQSQKCIYPFKLIPCRSRRIAENLSSKTEFG